MSFDAHHKKVHVVKTHFDRNGNLKANRVCAYCSNNEAVSQKCAQCGIAYYCNKDCQRQDWPEHKSNCSSLAAIHNVFKSMNQRRAWHE